MSKEKQIEEMANTINEMDEPNAHYYDETLQNHEAFADCFTIARHLYDKGYRKRIVAEWKGNGYMNHCSICGNVVNFNNVSRWLYNFCPNCGAKMKGGAE